MSPAACQGPASRAGVVALVEEVHRAVGARDAARSRLERARKDVVALEQSEVDARVAHDLLRAVACAARERVVGRVEVIGTEALRAIFARPEMEFRVRMEESRGVTSAWFEVRTVCRGEEVWVDVIDGRGGGVRDIVAFVIQAMVVTLTPGLRRLLILDEPFSQVSDGFLPAVAELLLQLKARLGMDIWIVTHEEVIASAADKVYRSRLVDGVTVVEEDPVRA